MTPFQEKVYKAVLQIPPGEVRSYKGLYVLMVLWVDFLKEPLRNQKCLKKKARLIFSM